MIRRAVVAGAFYPGSRDALTRELASLVPPARTPEKVLGVVAPHAGYMYSGRAAGELFGAIEVPKRVIILCPNHTGMGSAVSLWPEGEWETPLGRVRVDADLCARLLAASNEIEPETMAHQQEHAVEVQVPFLQYRNPSIAIAAIVLAARGWGDREENALLGLGRAIGTMLQSLREEVLIVASSDMTHYEPASVARVKDGKAIDFMERLDATGLYRYVARERVSMCGYAPAAVMMSACRERGASEGKLVRYMTSGDTTGDNESVVGYAALTVK